MSGEISKLLGLDEPEERKGIFLFFTSIKTSNVNERLDYDKNWEQTAVYGSGSHHNYLLVELPTCILPVCIGLVMAYMVYILMSFMFQTNIEELKHAELEQKVVFAPNYCFEDNAIPDKIRQLYEPIKTDLTKDSKLDLSGEPDARIANSAVGVHQKAIVNNYLTPIHKL